ncbi:hypothetical protein [uncultured Varibaculum sp.]|uniref:hypothetical protein n=1 Tax=uncultured Varibaculum sp. TaxID=413896 RepID=UPI0028063177|nr:hypothetical protein [uncultured Varibaculum sp.]
MPPGCAFHRARGGAAAFSDDASLMLEATQRIISTQIMIHGGKRSQIPKPIQPPPVGWRIDFEEKQRRRARKAAAHARRAAARKASKS